ncbi:hypothetical protein GCM10012275_24060 [Longimycelium tulufanense]|uniref:Uncharacterized protein n=1 Tax=Longimycelium tulufanense TaxID=907463 RepID=A0A8J3CDN2_9PSEU|nr:hypothetical protein GCM10012275_24060 [Longimycelium tulufanense]
MNYYHNVTIYIPCPGDPPPAGPLDRPGPPPRFHSQPDRTHHRRSHLEAGWGLCTSSHSHDPAEDARTLLTGDAARGVDAAQANVDVGETKAPGPPHAALCRAERERVVRGKHAPPVT